MCISSRLLNLWLTRWLGIFPDLSCGTAIVVPNLQYGLDASCTFQNPKKTNSTANKGNQSFLSLPNPANRTIGKNPFSGNFFILEYHLGIN